MKCPACLHAIAELWQPTHMVTDVHGRPLKDGGGPVILSHLPERDRIAVRLHWMICPNRGCQEILIRIQRTQFNEWDGLPEISKGKRPNGRFLGEAADDAIWLAVPRWPGTRPLPDYVPAEIRRDFREAELLLDVSHRSSAVLVRRILAYVLRRYAGREEFRLGSQIKAWKAAENSPPHLLQYVENLAQMGDFVAHLMKDPESDEVIDLSKDEAEWSLTVAYELIEYYVMRPARYDEVQSGWEAKVGRTRQTNVEAPVKEPPGPV